MAIGSGIGAQLGAASETTYGTAATPSRFFEFNSESIDYDKGTTQGTGLRAGQAIARANRRVVTSIGGKGDLGFDVATKGYGFWLALALGAVTTTQQAATIAYKQVHTLADLAGKSATVQVGVPSAAGVVTAKTALGCKVANLSISCAQGDLVKTKIGLDAVDVRTDVALASASYPTAANLFSFVSGSITVDGSAVAAVTDFEVTLDNGLAVDRRFLGAGGKKAEPQIADLRKIGGKLGAEFTDLTFVSRYLSDASVALVLTMLGTQIVAGQTETLKITIPAAKLNGETPKVGGPDIVKLDVGFDGLDDGTNPPITIEYTSTDTAP